MGRRSNGIIEERSEIEIQRYRMSRNENVDKICMIVTQRKSHEYKGKVPGVTQILVKNLMIDL